METQTTRAYGSKQYRPTDQAGRRRQTQELALGADMLGPVRLWIQPGIQDARPLEVGLSPGAELVVGSGLTSHVRVLDPTVSRRHCRVTHTGSYIEIADLDARNGLRVGGVLVGRAALPVGASCELGLTLMRVNPGPGAAKAYEASPLPGLVGNALPMRQLAADVRRFARLRLPVLLRGESGTGKDLVARAIHDVSPRAERPFVVLNAAAISRELAESELFGHARGAFTGAIRDRRGAFREAHGGTLFLDEIGTLSLEVQAKLLRAVEDKVVRPVGTETAVSVDVRLVAATCEALEHMVGDRRFRADLYERLAVCVVQVPPLRDRLDDVPDLVRHLLAKSELSGRKLSRDAIAALRAHRWPGNVRELRNVVVQAAVRAGKTIEAEHVAAVLVDRDRRVRRVAVGDAVRIFEEANGNVSEAARRAHLPRSTMRDLLHAAGVPKHRVPPDDT